MEVDDQRSADSTSNSEESDEKEIIGSRKHLSGSSDEDFSWKVRNRKLFMKCSEISRHTGGSVGNDELVSGGVTPRNSSRIINMDLIRKTGK